MKDYISTFTTGFQKIVSQQLIIDYPGTHVISLQDGLVHYRNSFSPKQMSNANYLNNTFLVLAEFEGLNINFKSMVTAIAKRKIEYPIGKGTFRIRFSKANVFEHVDKNISNTAEAIVLNKTKLLINRVNPDFELWYMIRSEGGGFYCQLLTKRKSTEKNLNKGELRPEFARLLCCSVPYSDDSVVYDPFCGFGSIPLQLANNAPTPKLILASDISTKKVEQLKTVISNSPRSRKNVYVFEADILSNSLCVPDDSVDIIITDPPWGYYEHIENIETFYIQMLEKFFRLLKVTGKMVIVSARKEEFEKALSYYQITNLSIIDTLVNGKKARVYIISK